MMRRRTITGAIDVAAIGAWRIVSKGLPIAVAFWLIVLLGATSWGAVGPGNLGDPEAAGIAEAIKTSGPATGAVLLLGLMLKAWIAETKAEIKQFGAKLDTQNQNFSTLREAQARFEARSDERHVALERRVDKIERRISGPTKLSE